MPQWQHRRKGGHYLNCDSQINERAQKIYNRDIRSGIAAPKVVSLTCTAYKKITYTPFLFGEYNNIILNKVLLIISECKGDNFAQKRLVNVSE